jgi:LSD1 subclass zinc finger protein
MLMVHCSFCKTPLRVPDNGAGKKVRCPRCGTALRVPDEAATASADRPRPGPPHQR